MIRVGIGYDSHRFTEGRPLVLGGVRVPHPRGLAGHSDADAVAHALTDAILGAAGAGDIGRLFPDTDPRWRDADSMDLLARAHETVRARGYACRQADVTVITEQPKLAMHVDAMAENLVRCLGLAPGDVSVKAKTNEGMGFIGRGEGLAVIAVATVEGRPSNRS
jgi:2-C-methyl-D-erythritol 2,4-cyclodiphosphate synthase